MLVIRMKIITGKNRMLLDGVFGLLHTHDT